MPFISLMVLLHAAGCVAQATQTGEKRGGVSSDSGASCGLQNQPCCGGATQPACNQEPLRTIELAVQDEYADLAAPFTEQVLVCDARSRCVPCGELGSPCCPLIEFNDELAVGNPFGRCERGSGAFADDRVCSAPNGTCKLLSKALADGDLSYTFYNPPAKYCPRIYFDAELRAFEHYGDCSADLDSQAALSAKRTAPATGPPPPPVFDGCLPTSSLTEVSCVGLPNDPQPCILASDLMTASVVLNAADAALQITGYALVPGEGGYECLYPRESSETLRQYGMCNEDGLLPLSKAGQPPKYNPSYPADRPFCDVNAPYGISYKASNGTIVPLLYMVDTAKVADDGRFLCCDNSQLYGGSVYGSTAGIPSRCNDACRYPGSRRCRRCLRG